MYISYDYYRIFYYVAKSGSISHAAKILLHDQPNLTRAIKALESELGCPLFVRTSKGMKLTPEGEKLYAHICIAFENIEAGEAEIVESRNMAAGSVYIAASEVALHCALLPALKKYRSLYPNIRLKISNHSTPQAIDAIRNGIANLAIVTTPTVSFPTIEEHCVKTFREVAVCSATFAQAAGLTDREIGFEEMLQYPMISLGVQTKSFELYSSFFAERRLQYLPETEASTADQILPMVQADLGIGFVPSKFLNGAGDVCILKTEEPLPQREIRIAKRKDQFLSIAAKKLYRLILEMTADSEDPPSA